VEWNSNFDESINEVAKCMAKLLKARYFKSTIDEHGVVEHVRTIRFKHATSSNKLNSSIDEEINFNGSNNED
jgi:hypothetical protein